MTAPLALPIEARFRASGVSEVQRSLRLVGNEGQATTQKYGMASRQIAGGLEQIARSGKITGESMKQIIAQGSEMAFLFGAGGPIVGAIGIVGVAIYEHITNRMKEAREEINRARREIEGLTDLSGVGRALQTRYSGNPAALRLEGESDAAFLARSRGLQGVRGRIVGVEAQLAALGVPAGDVARMGQGARNLGYGSVAEGLGRELRDLVDQLGKLKSETAILAPLFDRLAKAEGERAQNAAKLANQDYLKGLPLTPDQVAQHNRMDALLDPILKRGLPGPQRMITGGTLMTTPLGGAEGYRAFGLKPKDLKDIVGKFGDFVVTPLAEQITRSIADGVGNAISAGFDAAFAKGGNIGKAAAAMGSSALATIGGVFKEIGMQSLIGVQFMQAIRVAISSWNPAVGIAASLGLIALGSALQSAGSRVASNSAGGYGGGGGASYSAPQSIIDRGFINPGGAVNAAGGVSTRNMIVLAPTIIGVNDAGAQRAVLELVRNAERRGGVGTV